METIINADSSPNMPVAGLLLEIGRLKQQQLGRTHQAGMLADFEQELQTRSTAFFDLLAEKLSAAGQGHPLVVEAKLKQIRQELHRWLEQSELQRSQLAAVEA